MDGLFAESSGAATSLSLRATMERKLFNSSLAGGFGSNALSASNFCQFIIAAYHEQLGFAQYGSQKVGFGRLLLLKLGQ